MTPGTGVFARDRGVRLAAGAAAAAGIAGRVAAKPPRPLGADARATFVFAALASFAIVALSILPFVMWRGAWRRFVWVAVALAALTLGGGSFAAAGYTQRGCTAQYAGHAVT